MIIHENRLPADDSHEISYLICYFEKSFTNVKINTGVNVKSVPNDKSLAYVHRYSIGDTS